MKRYLATVGSVRDAIDLLEILRAHGGFRSSAQARGVPGRFPFWSLVPGPGELELLPAAQGF